MDFDLWPAAWLAKRVKLKGKIKTQREIKIKMKSKIRKRIKSKIMITIKIIRISTKQVLLLRLEAS